jgi:hypothetical protein
MTRAITPARLGKMVGVATGVVAFVAVFHAALAPDSVLCRRDALRLYLPIRAFVAAEIARGHVPTWFPFDGLGASLEGSAVGAPLAPVNLLGLVLNPVTALKVEVLLAFIFASLGAYRLARELGRSQVPSWLAAASYGLCGYLLSTSDNVPYLASAALLPWSAWCTERVARQPSTRSAAFLGLCLFLCLSLGDVQAFVLQSLFAAAVVAARGINRRTVRALGLAALVAAGLGAPLLGPIWANAVATGRVGGLPTQETLSWSLHPLRLLELAVGAPFTPDALDAQAGAIARFFGGGASDNLWTSSEAVGVFPIVLALASAFNRSRLGDKRVYGLAGALALVLALGRNGGLALLAAHVPGWNAFRYPEKLMPFVILGIGVLGGIELERWREDSRRARRCLLAAAGVLAFLEVIARPEVIARLLRLTGNVPTEDQIELMTVTWATRIGVALILVTLALGVLRFRPAAIALAATLLTAAQLIWLAQGVVVVASAQDVFRTPRLLEPLQSAKSTQWGRLLSWPERYGFGEQFAAGYMNSVLIGDLEAMSPDYNALHGLDSVIAYLPTADRDLVAACGTRPRFATPCSRRLAARYSILSTDVAKTMIAAGVVTELGQIRNPHLVLLEDPASRSMVSFAVGHHVASLNGRIEAVRTLQPEVAVLAGEGLDEPAPAGEVEWQRSEPGHLQVDLNLIRPGWLVVAEQCSSGWRGALDGTPIPVERADLALCAVRVPTGTHRLTLRYVPPGWPWAWFPFGLAALLFLACTVASLPLGSPLEASSTFSPP